VERERELCQALIRLRNEEENAKEVRRHTILILFCQEFKRNFDEICVNDILARYACVNDSWLSDIAFCFIDILSFITMRSVLYSLI